MYKQGTRTLISLIIAPFLPGLPMVRLTPILRLYPCNDLRNHNGKTSIQTLAKIHKLQSLAQLGKKTA
jgi:hypothetical protein